MEETRIFWSKTLRLIRERKIIVSLIVLAILGGGYYGYQKKTSGDSRAISYKTEAVEKGDISVSVTGTGQVEALTQVDLKPVVAGDSIEVMKVYVKNDQEVKKNQLIALLDAKDAQKSVRNAEVSLRSAEIKLKQTEDQYDRETKEDKWARQAQEIAVEQARNSLNDAKENLEDYYIRAPFDGIITNLSVESGDSISRSDILASVITKDSHAVITLNEVDATNVKEGDTATLTFDALTDISISGKVTKIDTLGTVSQGVVSYGAEISFDSQNEMLKPGMSVSAEILVESKSDILLVPSSAVKTQKGETYVLVLNTSSKKRQGASGGQERFDTLIPERKVVEVGITDNVYTEIVSGLFLGENVVTETVSGENSETYSGGGVGSSLRIPGLGGGGGPRN